MLAHIDINSYYFKAAFEKNPEKMPLFRARFPSLELPEDPEKYKSWYFGGDMIVDEADLSFIKEHLPDIEIKLRKVRGLANHSHPNNMPNAIYQISVANVGLMQVVCVDVLEDACTEELQRWLDMGWRILAVCPPNDARRPTYIMGHFEREPKRG